MVRLSASQPIRPKLDGERRLLAAIAYHSIAAQPLASISMKEPPVKEK